MNARANDRETEILLRSRSYTKMPKIRFPTVVPVQAIRKTSHRHAMPAAIDKSHSTIAKLLFVCFPCNISSTTRQPISATVKSMSRAHPLLTSSSRIFCLSCRHTSRVYARRFDTCAHCCWLAPSPSAFLQVITSRKGHYNSATFHQSIPVPIR